MRNWLLGKLMVGIVLAFFITTQGLYAEEKYTLTEVMDFDLSIWDNRSGGFAYNGEFYLALLHKSGSQSCYKSYDGINWTELVATSIYKGQPVINLSKLSQLIWDGKQFVGIYANRVLTSPDGETWIEQEVKHPNPNKVYTLRDIIYTGKQYILVGQDRDANVYSYYIPGPNTFLYSTDLVNFKAGTRTNMEHSIAGERPVEGLAYNGKNYIGYGNTSAVSSDGINWSGVRSPLNGFNVIWDGKQYLNAYMDCIAASKDGTNWKVVSVFEDTPVHLTTIGYNGRVYIVTGHNEDSGEHIVYYSKDLKKWSSVTTKTNKSTDTHYILPTEDGFLLLGNKVWKFEDKALNIPSNWATTTIETLKKLDFVPDNLFGLYREKLTRKEACELLVSYYEKITGEVLDVRLMYSPFSDTKDTNILKAYSLGIVSGRENGTFGPLDAVTRQDMAVILYNTIMKLSPEIIDSAAWSKNYEDINEIASYAVNAVKFLNSKQVLDGSDNKLNPRSNITREQALTILLRLYNVELNR